MKRREEEDLAKEFERDFADASAWEEEPAEPRANRRTLGTQVSIRLDADQASRLRRIAGRKRIGYTSLLRNWIEERLRAEDVTADLVEPEVTYDAFTMILESSAVTSTNVRWKSIQGATVLERRGVLGNPGTSPISNSVVPNSLVTRPD